MFFVAFHAGLVKRIDAQQITGNSACFPEEVNQVANIISIQRIYFNHADRHAAIIMGQNGAFHGLAVYNAHVLVSQEIQTIKVAFQRFNVKSSRVFLIST